MVAYFVGLSLLASRIRHQLLFVLRSATMGKWERPLGLVRDGPYALLQVCTSAFGSDCPSKSNILLRSFVVPRFPKKHVLLAFSIIFASPTRAQNSKLQSQDAGTKLKKRIKNTLISIAVHTPPEPSPPYS